MKVEEKISSAILQTPKKVIIGEKEYLAKPTTAATLIKASSIISQIPAIEINDETNPLVESFRFAKYSHKIAEAIAILVLGANNLEVEKVEKRKVFFGLIKYEEKYTQNNLEELSTYILENLSFKELHNLLQELLSGMELAFFFGIITILSEINLLKSTKETETIQSGPPFQDLQKTIT